LFNRYCDICKDFRFEIPEIHSRNQKFSKILGLKFLRYIAEIKSLVQVVIWYEYLVKFSPLIFADHRRYHKIFEPLKNTVMAAISN